MKTNLSQQTLAVEVGCSQKVCSLSQWRQCLPQLVTNKYPRISWLLLILVFHSLGRLYSKDCQDKEQNVQMYLSKAHSRLQQHRKNKLMKISTNHEKTMLGGHCCYIVHKGITWNSSKSYGHWFVSQLFHLKSQFNSMLICLGKQWKITHVLKPLPPI